MPIEMTASKIEWSPVPDLTKDEFDQFRALIMQHCGIKVSDNKKLLLKNRIGKRLKALGIRAFADYYHYVTTRDGARDEMIHLWSAITTNHSHFYREAHHFDILKTKILPEILENRHTDRPLRIWSAGCSNGQEVYTLASLLIDFVAPLRVEIIGTDIDINVLATAEAGEYPIEESKHIPAPVLKKYFEQKGDRLVVGDRLRSICQFKMLNLKNLSGISGAFDVIFCRNVIMYLDHEFRAQLARFYHQKLTSPGFLFLGSSESFHGMPRLFNVRSYGRSIVYCKSRDFGVQE